MVVYGAVLILLILLAVLKRGHRREKVGQYPKKWFGFLYPMGLWCYENYSKAVRSIRRETEQKAKAVYMKENALDKLEMDGVNRFVLIWLCLFIGTITSAVITMQNPGKEQEQLKRPKFGETETYHLTVSGLDETETIDVIVDGKQPSEEAMKVIFEEQFEQLKTSILGENTSLEEVRTDLKLSSSTEYGIRVQWESEKPDKINDWGEILTTDIEENGEEVEFLVNMTYSTYQSVYTMKIILFPKIKNQEFYLEKLMSDIQNKNQEDIEKEYLQLPKVIDEISFSYKTQKDNTGIQLFAFIIAGSVLILIIGYQKLDTQYKRRNQQMMIDYPVLVSKLNLLIGAGMAPGIAWRRIIVDYQKRKAEIRYVYEEMVITKNSIESGYPEARAYGEFGRRCGLYCYLKLGNLLEQNLKQGVAGLNQKLEEEMVYALEERKNMALRLGEEAGTRLLLPMFLMLGIIVTILIIPAFMSFYF